uniref:Uncharacterized protein n=1 Tax=Avena sativa TaxID=4498 RepID=A0ACD5W707_AVESA
MAKIMCLVDIVFDSVAEIYKLLMFCCRSFEGSCARLRTCFESLKPLFPESGSPMPMLDALVQQAFVGIDTITTVANSYAMPKREQNKDMLLKLLFHIKNRYSDMLTPDQRDEVCIFYGDIFGDILSFSASNKNVVRSAGLIPASRPSAVISSNGSFAGGPPGYAEQIEQSVSGPNHSLKPPAKSRDPRLRFLNRDPGGTADTNRHVNFAEPNLFKDATLGGVVSNNNRKHKAVSQLLMDEIVLKRTRGATENSRDMQVQAGTDGSNISSYSSDMVQSNQNTVLQAKTTGNPNNWRDSQLINNASSIANSAGTNTGTLHTSQSNSVPQTTGAPIISFPAVLKDIAVNPTVLMNWIQMEQQKRSASETQQTVIPSGGISRGMSSNVNAGMVIPPGNALKTEVAQIPSNRLPVSMQTTPVCSQNDAGVIRMKPRDPRRVLHNNTAQKNDTTSTEQPRSNGIILPDSLDNLVNREHLGERFQTSALPSQPVSLPNIDRPSIMSTSTVDPVSNSQLAASSLVPSHQASVRGNRADLRLAAGQNDPNADAASNAAPGTTLGAAPPANQWGDLDDLLNGYDDQQKALIQKERARRIMEQHKMGMICLVQLGSFFKTESMVAEKNAQYLISW